MFTLSNKLFLFFILFNFTLQECNKGCQYCDGAACLQCDLKNNYYKDTAGLCQPATSAQCGSIQVDGNCKFCIGNFFPPPTAIGDCTAVTTLINDCLNYITATTCAACATGFYLAADNLSCIAESTTIPNIADCFINQLVTTSTICLVCNDGFTVAPEGTSCIPNAATTNCEQFSSSQCNQCKPTFTMYFLTTKLKAFNDDFLTQSATYSVKHWFGEPHVVCQPQNPNCFSINADNSCECCDNKSFPSAILIDCQDIVSEFCAVMYDHELCKKCIDGYYQAADGQCVDTLGEGCKKKKHKVKKVREEQNDTKKVDKKKIAYQGCAKCTSKTQYYDGTTNKCTDVTVVDQCKTYHPFKNECLKCKRGNIILASTKKCAKKIKHCHTYANPGITASTSICLKCINKRYFNAGTCKKTETKIKKCQSFSNATTCVECSRLQFVSANACKKRTKTKHCDEFDPDEDKCTKCNDHYLVNAQGECVKIDDDNCLQGELSGTKQVCTECKKKYFVDFNGSCTKIKDKCGKKNFINPDTLQCVDQNESVANCQVYSAAGVCKYCEATHFLESSTSCVERSGADITGCQFYNGDPKCSKCTTLGQFPAADGLSCVAGTATNCATFNADGSACLTCLDTYLFDAEKVNCSFEKASVLDCHLFDESVQPPVCTCCKTPTNYVVAGACAIIPTSPSYESADVNCACVTGLNADSIPILLCGQCLPNFVLTPDFILCSEDLKNVSLLDGDETDNCNSYIVPAEAICVLCSPGFILGSDYTCVADTTVEIPGCLFQEKTVCKICSYGYTQGIDFSCTLHADVVQL